MIALAPLTFVDLAPHELALLASVSGFDALGFRLSPASLGESLALTATDERGLRDLRDRVDALGLQVLDIEAARLEAEAETESWKPLVEAAASLGAQFLLANCFDPVESRSIHRFGELCELAQPYGITPVFEAIPYSEARTLDAARRHVTESSGGLLVDPLHLQRGGSSVHDLTDTDISRMPYLQVCDAMRVGPSGGTAGLRYESRHSRLPIGEGELEVGELLSRLPVPMPPISVEAPNDILRLSLGDQGYASRLLQSIEVALNAVGENQQTQGRAGSPK